MLLDQSDCSTLIDYSTSFTDDERIV